MDGNFGLVRYNLHKIKMTLDSNKQIQSNSHIEKIVSVKDGDKCLACTIENNKASTTAGGDYTEINIATITEAGYVEGTEVDMWLACMRSSEGGSICDEVYVQADEDMMQVGIAWRVNSTNSYKQRKNHN
jgi:hypothetical protein